MPFLHIKSLPFDKPLDVTAALESLSKDFARQTGVGLEHVTATWEFLLPGHYVVGGKALARQSGDSHPIMVDLLAPDFHSAEQIEKMLYAVAASLSKRVGVPIENVFINHRQAHPGRVYEAGEVVDW